MAAHPKGMTMRSLLQSAAFVLLATAASAAKVKQLRADGEAQHKAGKHDDSMKSLAEAKKILGI